MKIILPLLILVCSLCCIWEVQQENNISVYFSPKGNCTAKIVEEIQKAKKTIKMQAYSFTSIPIADAILTAKKHGIDCEIILDKSRIKDKYSTAVFLKNQHIPILIDGKHSIAHNKIIIIDDSTIITGSFNFTKAAEERNAENLLIIRNHPDIALKYLDNYVIHKEHSSKSTDTFHIEE